MPDKKTTHKEHSVNAAHKSNKKEVRALSRSNTMTFSSSTTVLTRECVQYGDFLKMTVA
jgi:hypothetical protein